jgi:hypothetical protein
MNNTISYYVEQYGSDKVRSGYAQLYDPLMKNLRTQVNTFLEIGVGTLQPEIPSTFVGNPALYPQYKPGGSLRAWRDFFPTAQIYGVDVAEDCRFKEDRIETFIFSSLDTTICNTHFQDNSLDIIVDDGLHTAIGQLYTMYNFFSKVKDGGLYIIEDCGGGGDGTNVFVDFKENFKKIADLHEYYFGGNVIFIRKTGSKIGEVNTFDEFVSLGKKSEEIKVTENLTVVTGLWDINRTGREFSHYIENFKKFLNIPVNMFIYLPKELEYLVWENRQRNKTNTHVRIFELSDIKNNFYAPFWEKTQEIRTSPDWYNKTGEHGWLKNSPQTTLEYYNPIVQSKMFMLHDAKVMNVFDTDYFLWLDAGITNTVYDKYLTENRCFDKIIPLLKTFLFLSYPYEAVDEIHGFDFQEMNRIANQKVKYVCRGGLFGGHKDFITQANSTYYALLQQTLAGGHMGTEESIFSIMAHVEPHIYNRFVLDANGLIVKFIQALIDDTVVLEDVGARSHVLPKGHYNKNTTKTSLYVLSFNFPEQFKTLVESFEKHPEWLEAPRKILINNSQNRDIIDQYDVLCKQYGFEHLVTGKNLGINRGRLYAATHFQESDSDYYFFFEDDMLLHVPENKEYCRNGFRQYVPNLYRTVHEIMAKEEFDFLKLSYTEVYMDNNIQVSWYNVPQPVRSEIWPDYDQLPISGLDPNAPRTKFNHIDAHDQVSYISGDIYYANWPMIVSKAGNKKMFLDTNWEHPYEQTWMSYMFQETIAGNLNPAVLLASPINHNRISHYSPEVRREN